MADQKFKTLAAAAAAAEKQGIPFNRITDGKGCYWIRDKKPAAKKDKAPGQGSKVWSRNLALAKLIAIGFARVGDSDTFVQRYTGRRAWLTPAGKGRVFLELETSAALSKRHAAKKPKKKAAPKKKTTKKKAKRESVARSTVKGAKRGRKAVAKKTPATKAAFMADQKRKGASPKQAAARWKFKQKHSKKR